MVSKVVIVAFVALCCAQALAAPREEKMELESANLHMNIAKCSKSVVKVFGGVKDALAVVGKFIAIVNNGNAMQKACTIYENNTAEMIEACVSYAKYQENEWLVAEVKVAAQKVANVYEEIKDVINECT